MSSKARVARWRAKHKARLQAEHNAEMAKRGDRRGRAPSRRLIEVWNVDGTPHDCLIVRVGEEPELPPGTFAAKALLADITMSLVECRAWKRMWKLMMSPKETYDDIRRGHKPAP
jgi:hypothetical protein